MDNVQIDDCTGSDIAGSVSAICSGWEKADVVTLAADNIRDARVVRRVDGRAGLLESANLPAAYLGVLTLRHAIAIEHDALGLLTSLTEEFLDKNDAHAFKVDDDLFAHSLYADRSAILQARQIMGRDDCSDGRSVRSRARMSDAAYRRSAP